MDIAQLRKFISGRGSAGITHADNRVYTDKISGQLFESESEALESVHQSYITAGGQPHHRLRDLQNLYLASQ